MPGVDGERFDEETAYFGAQLRQLLYGELAEIGGAVDGFEQRTGGGFDAHLRIYFLYIGTKIIMAEAISTKMV